MCYINRFSLLWNVDLFRAFFPILGHWNCIYNVCVRVSMWMCGKSFYKSCPLCCVLCMFVRWRVCMNKYKITIIIMVCAPLSLHISFIQGILGFNRLLCESPPRDIELTINVTVNRIVHILDFVFLSFVDWCFASFFLHLHLVKEWSVPSCPIQCKMIKLIKEKMTFVAFDA